MTVNFSFPFRENVYQFTWARLAFKLATHAGSCTVLSMAFNPTAKCHRIKLWAEEMIPTTHSSVRPVLANTYRAQFLSTWNLPSLVRTFCCGQDKAID